MAVIPSSQLALARARKSMEQALITSNWDSVCELDKALSEALQLAVEDSHRDSRSLLKELAQILPIYRRLVEQCGQRQMAASDDTYLNF